MVSTSNKRWKQRYPKFRAHSFGDKKEAYALVTGICEIPKQYAFLTSMAQLTASMIRSTTSSVSCFVVKDCLGAGARQVMCIRKIRKFDEQIGTDRTMYLNILQPHKPARTCHEVVRYVKERMSLTQHLHPSGKPRVIIEEYIEGSSDCSGPVDYKVYVIGGQVRGIHMFWRGESKYEAAFTSDWIRVPLSRFYAVPENNEYLDRPASLPILLPDEKTRNRLLNIATRLAARHRALFCRYDFYISGRRILLGEITPVCGGIKNYPLTHEALNRLFPPKVRAKYG